MYNIVFTYTYNIHISPAPNRVYFRPNRFSRQVYNATSLQYHSFINIIFLLTLGYILYFACVPNCKGRYSMI